MKTQHRYCMITGASQGLGRAFAEYAASRGWNLLIAALPDSGLDDLAAALSLRYEVDVVAEECDLTEADDRDRLIDRAEEFEIAALINNAGVDSPGRFTSVDVGRLLAMVELNNLALVEITHRLLPQLGYTAPDRYILNVSSLSSYFPIPYMAVYAASKSFVLQFSLALRAELAKSHISVSVLCPSGIRTSGDVIRRIEVQGLMGRITSASPKEVARYAFESMLARRAVIIPGGINRFLRRVSTLIPAHKLATLLERRFSRIERHVPDTLQMAGDRWSWS